MPWLRVAAPEVREKNTVKKYFKYKPFVIFSAEILQERADRLYKLSILVMSLLGFSFVRACFS